MDTIILFAPLAGALIAGLMWRVITDVGAQWVATGIAFFAAALAWILWAGYDGEVQQTYILNWLRSGTLDVAVGIRLDALSTQMMVVVTTLSAFAHLYALGFMERDKAFDEGRSFRPRFFAYLSLFSFAMLLLVSSDNLVQILVGLQLTVVMAYLLVSFRHHYKNANAAAIKCFIVCCIGLAAMVVGVAGLFALADSFALDDVFEALPDLQNAPLILGLPAIEVCAMLILIGAMAVSAQVFLHVWLPDAMEAPAPAAALLTALMVSSGAFVIWRLMPLYQMAPLTSDVMMWIGLLTALLGALIASAQTDIKRAIGFVASSHIGVIFVAFGVGAEDVAGIQIPLFVVIQAVLVLCVGAVTRAMDDTRDMSVFGGLRQKLPTVALAMALASVVATAFGVSHSFLGVIAPRTGNLLFASLLIDHPSAFWTLCCAAGLGVFAIWRIVFLCFSGTSRAPEDVFDAVERTPAIMAMGIAGLSLVMIGFVAWEVSRFDAMLSTDAPGWTSICALVVTSLGFVLALWLYVLQPSLPRAFTASMPALYQALRQGFYVDQFYETVMLKPLRSVGDWVRDTGDSRILNGAATFIATRLLPVCSRIVARPFGGALIGLGFAVFFGLVAVITWTILAGGSA